MRLCRTWTYSISSCFTTPLTPQVEKERELELREKLEEQRRALQGEHEAALQGEDGDAALGRAWEGPRPSSRGLPLAPPTYLWSTAASRLEPVESLDLSFGGVALKV